MYYFRMFLMAVLLLSAAGLLKAGTVSGFIHDKQNGERLIGANAWLDGLSLGASSNTAGYFIITDIPAGLYWLQVEYIGYHPLRREIRLSPDEDLVIKIALIPDVLETEAIVVTADSVRTSERLYQQPISQVQLSPQEIRRMPQIAEADLLRTLQALPGILPSSDYSSDLYVRGGTPDQNLFLVDGADVYNPEHVFGLFSTFNTDAIKDVQLSRGGFGADFGGRLSSILDVTNLDGNRNEFEGSAAISLLSAKTTLQMPLGSKGSVSASLRRTYFDKTIGPYIEEVPDYYFYDGHLKAFFDLNEKNKLSLSTYFGDDVLDYVFNPDIEDSPRLYYKWGNRTYSLRWTHIFTPRLFSNFWLTGSQYRSDFKFGDNLNETNSIDDLTAKGSFEYVRSAGLRTKFGFEAKHGYGRYREEFPGGLVNIDVHPNHFIGYGLVEWQPAAKWLVESGLRYNYFFSNADYQNWEPRFSAKYKINQLSSLKFSTGLYHQYLNRIPRLFFADIWTTADKNYGTSSAVHAILGYQREVAKNLAFETEVYYKRYYSIYSFKNFITELRPSYYTADGLAVYDQTNGLYDKGEGHSQGIEFLLRKNFGSISGWSALAFSETRHHIQGLNQDQPYTPRHDRTIVFNTVANMDLKNAWREVTGRIYKAERSTWLLGINFIYSSGQPITLSSSTYAINPFPDRDYDDIALYPTELNTFRLPYYSRLDISLTWQKHFKNWTMEPYLQVYNAGNRENIWFIQYTDELSGDKLIQNVDTVNMLPLLPTIGVNFKF